MPISAPIPFVMTSKNWELLPGIKYCNISRKRVIHMQDAKTRIDADALFNVRFNAKMDSIIR
jgi:hypothetical protein